jgi:hypothetical protein
MRRLVLAVALVIALPAAADSVRHRFESSVSRDGVRRVVIDIPAGDVDIRNGDGDTIRISGYVSRNPDSDRNRAKEQRIVDDASVEIVARDKEAVVQRHFGPQAQGWRAGMFSNYHIAVDVPRGIDIDVRTKFGDLTIDGSFGDIDVDMRAGDVTVRLPKKDIRQLNASARVGDVHARLGDETIEHDGFPGNTRYANPAGKTIVNVHVTAGDLNVTLTQ